MKNVKKSQKFPWTKRVQVDTNWGFLYWFQYYQMFVINFITFIIFIIIIIILINYIIIIICSPTEHSSGYGT